jgi:hypothetical protein
VSFLSGFINKILYSVFMSDAHAICSDHLDVVHLIIVDSVYQEAWSVKLLGLEPQNVR